MTIANHLRIEGEPVKGSRFIVDVGPVSSEDAAREMLAVTRTDFPDASHHCWAWRIAQPAIERASDDGEPSGSAGRPILAQLAGRDLVDTAAIVVRYFGGTKLGLGGLVRAYGGAAGAALESAPLIPWVEETTIDFEHDYQHTDAIERLLTAVEASILSRSFDQRVVVSVRLPTHAVVALGATLADLTAGAVLLPTHDEP